MNNNKPKQNSKCVDNKKEKIIRFLKKLVTYLIIIIISLICGAWLAVNFPNIRLLIENMSNSIILVIIFIIIIYLTIKLSGLSIKTFKSFNKKYKATARLVLSLNLLVLLIIPFIFYLVSVLFESGSGISLSDYFNYFGVILTAEFSFLSIYYQLSVSRKDEKERFTRQQVINGMDTIKGNYKSINDSLDDARDEWIQNISTLEYSSLNFEKMRSLFIEISNYNFTCQQEINLFRACGFKNISDKIEKLNEVFINNVRMENKIITEISEKKGKIDENSKKKVFQMNVYLLRIQGSIESLNKEISIEILDLKVNDKKLKPRLERAWYFLWMNINDETDIEQQMAVLDAFAFD